MGDVRSARSVMAERLSKCDWYLVNKTAHKAVCRESWYFSLRSGFFLGALLFPRGQTMSFFCCEARPIVTNTLRKLTKYIWITAHSNESRCNAKCQYDSIPSIECKEGEKRKTNWKINLLTHTTLTWKHRTRRWTIGGRGTFYNFLLSSLSVHLLLYFITVITRRSIKTRKQEETIFKENINIYTKQKKTIVYLPHFVQIQMTWIIHKT